MVTAINPGYFKKVLLEETARAKATLLATCSNPHEGKVVVNSIQATFGILTARQTKITIRELKKPFLSGVELEADYLAGHKLPGFTGIDLTEVSEKNYNRVAKSTIGKIGEFNAEFSKNMQNEYWLLSSNNELVNDILKRGKITAESERALLRAGVPRNIVDVIKQQETAKRMVELIEMNGIRGGMHPNDIAMQLRPIIRAFFGEEGVLIDNRGKFRQVLEVTPDGKYRWVQHKIEHTYRTTVENYADTVARSSMLRAHNEGRLASLEESGLCEKLYRFVAAMTANTCETCMMMHGQLVDPYEVMPPIHPKCGCRLAPVWKADTGLTNHSDGYYVNQRDEWFYKTYQTKEYNKGLPTGERIPNYNFLPKDALGELPTGAEMRQIRAEILGVA